MTSRHPPPQPPPPSSSSPSPSPPPTSFASSISSASQTNNNRPRQQHIRDQSEFSQPDPTKKPFTSSSYRSRFSSTSSDPNSPVPRKRRSIFVEQLDSTDQSQDQDQDHISQENASIASSSSPKKNTRSGEKSTYPFLSINPLGQKDSYMMHLPVQPLRISVLILFLVAFTTISLSTSAESDLDSLLLKRVPGEEGVVERREASIAPSFRIGPAVRNPEKDIPKLRTGILVLVVSLVFAGLMT
ncbi:hypothetical protein TWF718_001908 [Orbilia javanica]|uniref:Uncharacterized protein n=1 Tax=Orbilia javanica TaxID=47235 RepID=A0AAN8RHQ5_9PEZI